MRRWSTIEAAVPAPVPDYPPRPVPTPWTASGLGSKPAGTAASRRPLTAPTRRPRAAGTAVSAADGASGLGPRRPATPARCGTRTRKSAPRAGQRVVAPPDGWRRWSTCCPRRRRRRPIRRCSRTHRWSCSRPRAPAATETRLSTIGEDVLTPTDGSTCANTAPPRTSSRSRGGCGSKATSFTRPWCQVATARPPRPDHQTARGRPAAAAELDDRRRGRCLPCQAGPPRANDRLQDAAGATGVLVKSARSAGTVLRPPRFSGPLPEPGVHLSMHRALHKSPITLAWVLIPCSARESGWLRPGSGSGSCLPSRG